VGDITYIRLRQEFVYLAVLMDVYTRSISPAETLRERGWHLARSMDQSLTLKALEKALKQGHPEIHHSDQGVQYAATAYVNLLSQHQVAISNSPMGIPCGKRATRKADVGAAIALRAFKKGKTATLKD
jgi:putative transposase